MKTMVHDEGVSKIPEGQRSGQFKGRTSCWLPSLHEHRKLRWDERTACSGETEPTNLKQNEAQSARAESTHRGVN